MQRALDGADTPRVRRARSIAVALFTTVSLGLLAPGAFTVAVAIPLDVRVPMGSAVAMAPLERPASEPREPGPVRHTLVRISHSMPITVRPGGGRVVGTMPAGSRFYDQPLSAWVLEVSDDGRYGLVPVPYAGRQVLGWIALRGLDLETTGIEVVADLSEHLIQVRRGGDLLFRAQAATGASVSPTPVGHYFVTDRVAFPEGGSFGTFAFGISGIQTHLPPGWTGGDQLAIHGTSAPGTIGTSASAGCLRVSERVLDRLRPLLRLGTPVTIVP